MYASLGSIDILGCHETTGQKCCLQTDHREAQECEDTRELSTLFALIRTRVAHRSGGEGEPPPLVRYIAAHEPPPFLQAAIAAAGGLLEVEWQGDVPPGSAEPPQSGFRPVPFEGTPPCVADLADDAFRGLARRVLVRREEELRPEALAALERDVLSRRPSQEEDEIAYWTCVLELAAVCGELLRSVTGGRWNEDPHPWSVVPLAFELPQGGFANVAGKAQRFLAEGVCRSPSQLLRLAEGGLCGGEQPGPVMLSFKAPGWSTCDMVVGRSLIDDPDPAYADVPWIVYCRNIPHAISMFPRNGKWELEIDDLHRQALENLRDIEVDVGEMDASGIRILIASGSFYASEKILDPAFMRQMHGRLDTPLIAAGVPRKGLLIMTSALQPPENLARFMGVLEAQYNEEGEGAKLTPCPILVDDGEIKGVLRRVAEPGPQASPVAVGAGPRLPGGANPAPVGPGVPGASVTPGPLPPIVVDFSEPRVRWLRQAAAVLSEAGVVEQLAVKVRTESGIITIPAVCSVGGEPWAPYFEGEPWHAAAVGRLNHTLSVLRESRYRTLRLQVYSPFVPPPLLVECVLGGPLPVACQGGRRGPGSVLVGAGIALAVILVAGFVAVLPPRVQPGPVARPARVAPPRGERPSASPPPTAAGRAVPAEGAPAPSRSVPVVDRSRPARQADDPNRLPPAE